jgi:hypothetical protein
VYFVQFGCFAPDHTIDKKLIDFDARFFVRRF